jgi:ABC-type cobalamin transport system ATPase subunit
MRWPSIITLVALVFGFAATSGMVLYHTRDMNIHESGTAKLARIRASLSPLQRDHYRMEMRIDALERSEAVTAEKLSHIDQRTKDILLEVRRLRDTIAGAD